MKNRGFTLFEILVALFILTLLIGMITFSFSKLNSKQALETSTALILAVLNEARSLTLASQNGSQYGVHFEASRVILFKGSTYWPSLPSNVVTELNSLIGLDDIAFSGGGPDIIFKRLTGSTDQYGTARLFLKASPETLRTVSISATGVSNAGF